MNNLQVEVDRTQQQIYQNYTLPNGQQSFRQGQSSWLKSEPNNKTMQTHNQFGGNHIFHNPFQDVEKFFDDSYNAIKSCSNSKPNHIIFNGKPRDTKNCLNNTFMNGQDITRANRLNSINKQARERTKNFSTLDDQMQQQNADKLQETHQIQIFTQLDPSLTQQAPKLQSKTERSQKQISSRVFPQPFEFNQQLQLIKKKEKNIPSKPKRLVFSVKSDFRGYESTNASPNKQVTIQTDDEAKQHPKPTQIKERLKERLAYYSIRYESEPFSKTNYQLQQAAVTQLGFNEAKEIRNEMKNDSKRSINTSQGGRVNDEHCSSNSQFIDSFLNVQEYRNNMTPKTSMAHSVAKHLESIRNEKNNQIQALWKDSQPIKQTNYIPQISPISSTGNHIYLLGSNKHSSNYNHARLNYLEFLNWHHMREKERVEKRVHLDTLLSQLAIDTRGQSPLGKPTFRDNTFTHSDVEKGPNNLFKETSDLLTKPQKKSNLNLKSTVYDGKFKFFVGQGNNGQLVKRILESREWWSETSFHNSSCNFKWQQGSEGFQYERLMGQRNSGVKQCVNHFEFHGQISTQSGLIKNLMIYCETNQLNLFTITPVTFVIDFNEGNCQTELCQFALFYFKYFPQERPKPSNLRQFLYEFKTKFKSLNQLLNHDQQTATLSYCRPRMHSCFIDGSSYLWFLKPTGFNRGRGIEIFNSLEALEQFIFAYYQGQLDQLSYNQSDSPTQIPTEYQFDSLPETQSYEHGADKQDENEKKQSNENQQSEEQCRINQPNASKTPQISPHQQRDKSNQNNSIKISNAQNLHPGNLIQSSNFVIQKYIEKPMLINDRKFDIRVWVLVTHEMDVLFFKEGYIRTSSETFSLDQNLISNYYIHLTNNAVQQNAQTYGQFEDGNQISFDQFEEIINQNNGGWFNFRGTILPQIKQYSYYAMSSVKRKLNSNQRKYSFEIFGFDYIIDSQHNPWLIEVNTNPCIQQSSNLLKQIIPRMLDDAFQLTIDILFPQSNYMRENQDKLSTEKTLHILQRKAKVKFSVDGYSDEENMWEMLGSIANPINTSVTTKFQCKNISANQQ